ncbi:hypothetical protein HMI54_003566 [Coelomomyces lativittatus]|nr:hypothetical protein HMI54_003566 [Coelomomyces lativittatus]
MTTTPSVRNYQPISNFNSIIKTQIDNFHVAEDQRSEKAKFLINQYLLFSPLSCSSIQKILEHGSSKSKKKELPFKKKASNEILSEKEIWLPMENGFKIQDIHAWMYSISRYPLPM